LPEDQVPRANIDQPSDDAGIKDSESISTRMISESLPVRWFEEIRKASQ